MISRILLGLLAGASFCLAQERDSAYSTLPLQNAGKDSAAHAVPPKSATLGSAGLLLFEPGQKSDVKPFHNLFLAIDQGQAVQGVYDYNPNGNPPYQTYDRLWQQKMVLYFTEGMVYKERLSFLASIGCDLRYSMYPLDPYPATVRPEFYWYANDVEASYTFGNLSKPWLKIALGYFPFKYNEDAKDLGEYLLRCEAYPTVIVTDFELPLSRELGFHLSGFAGNPDVDLFGWDVMFTSETHTYPLLDGTLTGVVSNRLYNFLEVGAGVSFQRLIPVDNDKTLQKTNPSSEFFEENGDTSHYVFSATKLMIRASINPQRFIPEFKLPPSFVFGTHPFFGKEDLKIYGEVAILGTNNYVAYDSIPDGNGVNHWQKLPDSVNYYNDKMIWGIFPADRTPVMLGINLPTNPLLSYGVLPFFLTKWLKDETGSDIRSLEWVTMVAGLASGAAEQFLGWDCRLDVLSLEFEWFSQRYPNSDYLVRDPNSLEPLPLSNENRISSNFGTPAPTKYALYFKKSFANNRFALSGLVGRDHMKPVENAPAIQQQTDDFLQTSAQWWWTFRLSANF